MLPLIFDLELIQKFIRRYCIQTHYLLLFLEREVEFAEEEEVVELEEKEVEVVHQLVLPLSFVLEICFCFVIGDVYAFSL
jgi:hypothetical protein